MDRRDFLGKAPLIAAGLELALRGKNFSGMSGHLYDFIHEKVHELMWGKKSAISSILGLS